MVETLISIGIFLLLTIAVVEIFLFSFRSKEIVFDQLATQSQGRRAVQDFVNELRSAKYSDVGGYPLAQASSTQIIFYSNIDTDVAVEKVRYFLATTTLKKGITKSAGNPLTYTTTTESVSTLVENVRATTTIFRFYDQNYTGSSTPMTQPVSTSDVRLVEVILTLDRDITKSPVPIVIQAKTTLRNLKSN